MDNPPPTENIFSANMRQIKCIFTAYLFSEVPKYIYEYPDWTKFTWKDADIHALFGEVRHLQGKIYGQMHMLGFEARQSVALDTLAFDVLHSSEIEGEMLNPDQVRSSIGRRLGIPSGGLISSSKQVEGIVEMMLDATQNFRNPLTHARLFAWHAALFPSGYSGMHKIEVGQYRTGEMQIVSGPMGQEKVYFEAIPAAQVQTEMDRFIQWFNQENSLDPVMKAAIAHFWFIIIHPFDDGNGRIGRAISDMLLARADQTRDRFYSMSSRILVERKQYYKVLREVQYSQGDITDWLIWFLRCLHNALLSTLDTLTKVFQKVEFWKIHEATALNERQRFMLNKLLDGIEGKLKSSKWAQMAKCSPDTALRDIKDLQEKGILRQEAQGGRSTNYELVEF
jgi:Fic family protein